MAKILIVDDEIGILELLSEILTDEGHDVILAENASAARNERNKAQPDLVLLDIWMPDTDGITLLKEWMSNGQLSMPVIMMSGHGTIDTAVEATKIGAVDYLEKPIALQKLLSAVKRNLQNIKAKKQIVKPFTLSAIANSNQLKDLRKKVEQVIHKSRVLLLRNGAGSIAELIAQSYRTHPELWLDLGNRSDPLETRQLQNYAGGVLFVAELADLNRVQQKNLIFAMGRLERFNLHLISATTKKFEELVELGWEEKTVRRLFESYLVPPTLADLQEDIPEIAERLLQYFINTGEINERHFSSGALAVLKNQGWSGGYSELRATVKALALSTLDPEISVVDARRIIVPVADSYSAISMDQPLREAREAFERLYFEYHLRMEGGNMTKISEKSGLERTHLYRKLKQLGIHGNRKSEEK